MPAKPRSDRIRLPRSVNGPWSDAELDVLREELAKARTVHEAAQAMIHKRGSRRSFQAIKQQCSLRRWLAGARASAYEQMVAMFEAGASPDDVEEQLGVTPSYARRTWLQVLAGMHEGAPKAAGWPEDAPHFSDVGRADLIREMLPFRRFMYMPSAPPRHSGAGCSMAML